MKASVEILNCFAYISDKECGACNSGYYPIESGKTCSEQPTKIAECNFYKAGNKCLICNKGFRPSVDETSCEAETVNVGCEERSGVCESCRVFHWAVDFSLTAGQICEYPSLIPEVFLGLGVALFHIFS